MLADKALMLVPLAVAVAGREASTSARDDTVCPTMLRVA